MPTIAHSSESELPHASPHSMPHQLFHGTTWHSRLLPSVHKFAYPYRYWGVNISALAAGQALPEVSVMTSPIFRKSNLFKKGLLLFSAQHNALQQFCPEDYLHEGLDVIESIDAANTNSSNTDVMNNASQDEQTPAQTLSKRLQRAFVHHTGSAPTGDMLGLVVCRNVGIYFSPVNFYLGFDSEQTPTHLLAEVSNTPWNKRHYYGFLLDGVDTEFRHDKNFHVSPFNPIDQQYHWQVSIKPNFSEHSKSQEQNCLEVRIAINISDARGTVLKTGVKMTSVPMTDKVIRHNLRKNPLMNISSLTRIYWHALKLYAIKKVPYINYDEKLADSQQQEAD
ncbi:DUF1365 domain-containing protein [Psychrobacter sp. CAL346-MNA-CIBAN-0220]|uniref:DUF1365 domain-containing protein n=1 Tax=Psychrobacter sp. CAL346-MNA-CIBAN-0220 TaxID=3140457 RepID=UPI0033309E41